MASNILRMALRRGVGKSMRVMNVARMSGVSDVVANSGLKVNEEFHENLYTPLPSEPRAVPVADDLKALKEKELGDWKNLSKDEQMDLYNMYFSMSMGDMVRGNDSWKTSLGLALLVCSFGFAVLAFCKEFILPPMPHTISEEWVQASIKKQLQLKSNPITGYASKWDYENNCWKK